MIADISKIDLHSRIFAELVKVYTPVSGMKDGVVYVRTNNDSSWNAAVRRAKLSFENCSMRRTWLMKYDVDIFPEGLYKDNAMVNYLMGTEGNLIMPVSLPDRMEQYYFVGSVDIEHLESAASFLSVDAQSLMEACLPCALTVVDENDLERISQEINDGTLTDEWADELRRLNESGSIHPSFRGLHFANPIAMLGDVAAAAADKITKGLQSYRENRKLIMNLPSIGKKLRDEDPKKQEQGKVEYAQVMAALSEHERALLLHALVKEAKPKSLKNILIAIADRESLGAQTKYRVVFKPYQREFKNFGFDDNYKNCLFVADGETLHPVKMNKSPLVIYTLSLIEKVTKNKRDAIVDVKANNKAYSEVYKFFFHDFNMDTTQKRFKELFYRYADDLKTPIRSGRLTENYNDIEASLLKTFMKLDEDYSPFLANSTTPLAITAEKIDLPQELMNVQIH